jgi:hypothetical protein
MNYTFNNQNTHYPVILIPDTIILELFSEIKEDIVRSDLGLTKPSRPKIHKPQRPLNFKYVKQRKLKFEFGENSGCLIMIFIGAIILSPVFAESFTEGVLFIFYGSISYSLLLFVLTLFDGKLMFKIKFPKEYRQVPLTKEELDKLNNEYYAKSNLYEKEIEKAEDDYLKSINYYNTLIENNKDIVKRKIYISKLKPKISATRGALSLKRGAAELKFLELLLSKFKGMVYVDMVPRFSGSFNKNTYNPDFTFICKETDLHIDIEIDEPYTLVEKKPIHYIGSEDEGRNDFFLNNNWCIIKFSERQIEESPLLCIETIQSVYDSLIKMSTTYNSEVKIEKRWTYEESLLMQKGMYRERYLKIQ